MGGSSGSSSKTPYEQTDSSRSKQRVRIVEIISEGEIQGLVNDMQSIYLDKTPVQAKDNSYNFSNFTAEGTVGSQSQSIMKGFDSAENEKAVSVKVKYGSPIIRTVSDPDISRLRITLGVSALFEQKENGDTVGTKVELKVTVGNTERAVVLNEKHASQFLTQIIIDKLPTVPFTIKVERLTADSSSSRLQNDTIFASYTEIIDTQLSYPNTALAGVMFDSDYFNNIPTRNYEIYGLVVKIPSNYDANTRTYSGLWDGTFKLGWTDNPAWVLYDLLTNTRYGMGTRLNPMNVDKWTLYNVAKYCDQLVPDGYGNQEPRMRCNAWITEQKQAYEVVNDLCSIFRAMPVWNGTVTTVVQDRKVDPTYTYTNSNVIDGTFVRSYSALKARHTAIQVEWANPENFYEREIVYVADDEMIRRYGLNVQKVTAFGCTSRGQAYRHGKWMLETEKLERESLSFSIGREGLYALPGDIIEVIDNNYIGSQLTGRVKEINGAEITLDREIDLTAKSISYYTADRRKTINVISQDGSKLQLGESLELDVGGIVGIQVDEVKSEYFKLLSIKENDDGTFDISAIKHDPNKEAIVDNGAHFDEQVNTLHDASTAQLTGGVSQVTEEGMAVSWNTLSAFNGTVSYQIKLYKDERLYKIYNDLPSPDYTFSNLPNGNYIAEVRAKNNAGQYSQPAHKKFVISYEIQNLTTKPELFAIKVTWDVPKFTTTSFIEIWFNKTNDLSTAQKGVSLSYPTDSWTLAGVSLNDTYYFWARIIDASGTSGLFTSSVSGKAEQDASILVENLQGKITDSELGETLLNQLTSFDNSITSLNKDVGVLDKNVVSLFQTTSSLGTGLQSIEQVTDNQAQQIQTVSAAANGNKSAIQNEKNARIAGDTAEAQARQLLATQVNSNKAAIQNEISARVTADKAEAQAREILATQVSNNKSSITTLSQTLTTNTESVVKQITNLSAKVDSQSIYLYGKNRDEWIEQAGTLREMSVIDEFLRIGNNESNDQAWLVNNKRFPIGSNDVYKITVRFVQRNGNGVIYLGGQGYAEDGVTLVNSGGNNSYGSQHYFWSRGNLKSQWMEITGYLLGKNAYFPTHSNVIRMHENVYFFSPLFLCNYPSTSGITDFDYISVEKIDSRSNLIIDDIGEVIGSGNYQYSIPDYKSLKGKSVTISCDIDIQNATKLSSNQYRIGTEFKVIFSDGTYQYIGVWYNLDSTTQTLSTRISNSSIILNKDIVSVGYAGCYIQCTGTYLKVGHPKLEFGNKATPYSQLEQAQAIQTIRTEAIAGNRRAIAGISVGAMVNEHEVESEVIVMADKFGVVKDAGDGTVKPMFSVVNNTVGINGDLIADGTILGKHIKANETISAPKISGGTISGSVISGNTINGGSINGATGYFSGSIYAQNIVGDVTKTYIVTNGQSVTIPSAPFNRYVMLQFYNVVVNVGFSGTSYAARRTITTYVNNSVVNTDSSIGNPNYPDALKQAQPFKYYLPANISRTFKVTGADAIILCTKT